MKAKTLKTLSDLAATELAHSLAVAEKAKQVAHEVTEMALHTKKPVHVELELMKRCDSPHMLALAKMETPEAVYLFAGLGAWVQLA